MSFVLRRRYLLLFSRHCCSRGYWRSLHYGFNASYVTAYSRPNCSTSVLIPSIYSSKIANFSYSSVSLVMAPRWRQLLQNFAKIFHDAVLKNVWWFRHQMRMWRTNKQQIELECAPIPMAALSNIGGALCESLVIPFLVRRRKVWLTPAAGVPSSTVTLPI